MRELRSGTIVAAYLFLAGTIAFAVPPQIVWTASYNGPGSYWDSVSDATVHDGFLHVVGFTTVNFLDRAYITVKYAADGSEVWSRIYEGFVDHPNETDAATAVAVDASGNVFVSGYSVEADDETPDILYADAVTLKYSPTGELLWEQRYRGSGSNVQPSAIVLDPEGFLYVTGGSWIDGGFDVFLLKYDLDGNLVWSRTGGQPGQAWDNAFDLTLDHAGNVILGGYTQPGDLDVYILSYARDGALRWEWSLFGVGNVEQVNDLTVDDDGNTYALAEYAPPGTFTSLLTLKLDSAGALVWSDVYTGESTGDYAAGIELAPDGSVFAAGAAWENGSQNGMTLIKYAPDGQRLWSRSERGSYYSAECNDLALDADGDAYMTGFAFNENGREDYLTAKYDGSGNLVWTSAWNAPEGRSDIGYLIRVGTDDRVYVVGDAWRDFDRYYDITSVIYQQGEPAAITLLDNEIGSRFTFGPNPVVAGNLVTLRSSPPGPLDLFGIDGRRVLRIRRNGSNEFESPLQFVAPSSGTYMLRTSEGVRKLVVLGN